VAGRPSIFQQPAAALLAASALTVVLAVLALRTEPVVEGDGAEYLLMAESVVRHAGPDLKTEELLAVRQSAGPRGLWSREVATLSGFFEGRDGRRYCWHFWAYPMLTVPVRLALEGAGGDPLRALPLTNALCLGAMILAVLIAPAWPLWHRILFAALLLGSPILPFLRWTAPEAFVFSATAAALMIHERHPRSSVLLAALASWQAPPLLLLVALLWTRVAVPVFRARDRRGLATLTATAAVALVHPLFYLALFSTTSLCARESGMTLGHISAARAVELALDPNIGLLTHTAVAILLAPFIALGGARGGGWRRLEPQLVLAAAAIGLACTYNHNWNNGTSGPSRYALWLLPLLLYALSSSAARLRASGAASVLGAAVLLQCATLIIRGGVLAPVDYLEHSASARALLDRWPALYNPTHEIFVERTEHADDVWGPPPHIYRNAQGACRKALIRQRNAERVEEVCGRIPEPLRSTLLPRSPDLDERNTWVYVDW
jgi:hypothetical protein